MLSEKESVQYLFNKNFKYCKKRKIILYGELKGIKYVLSSFPEFTFSGIIIKDYSKKTCLGRKALDICHIKKNICDFVVMVDFPDKLREDFILLGPVCVREKIALYDLRGISFLEKRFYLSKEEQFIFEFETNFGNWKNNNIALCGEPEHLNLLINNLTNYNIIGILSNNPDGLESIKKPALNHKKVLEYNIELIICLSETMINEYAAYFHFCHLNKIRFFSLTGIDLCEQSLGRKTIEPPNSYFNINEQQLRDGIIWNDIICFSVFDCLLVQKTLDSEDFEKLSRQNNNKTDLESIESLVKSRKKMVELFNYALENEKIIYIILESEIPPSYIKTILNNCNIVGYKDLLVCKDQSAKEREKIFKYIRNNHRDDTCLYIGTDSCSCAELSSGYNINFFTIKSPLEMLDISTYKYIQSYVHNINDRSLIGLVISHLFNDPFALNKSDGKPQIYTLNTYTRTFIAPLVTTLILWLGKSLENTSYDKILFSSRDGYLINKLYNKLRSKKSYMNTPEGIYFLISRRVASCSGITEKSDLTWLFNLSYRDSIRNVLIDKFEFTEKDTADLNSNNIWTWISKNSGHIFKHSKKLKSNYLKYLENIGITGNHTYGFYDMVSSGTSQYFLSKILNADIKGFYLCWYDIGDLKRRQLPITSMFANNRISPENIYSDYVEGGYIYSDYDLLEMLLSSPDPSLKEFDDTGQPVYLPEKRTQDHIYSMQKAQETIENFFNEYLSLWSEQNEGISESLAEELFSYKNTVFTNVNCKYFSNLINFDDLGLIDKKIK